MVVVESNMVLKIVNEVTFTTLPNCIQTVPENPSSEICNIFHILLQVRHGKFEVIHGQGNTN